MRLVKARGGFGAARAALCLASACLGACHGCDTKTPVPFKRPSSQTAGADAGPPKAVEAPAEATSYEQGTQQIRVADTTVVRPNGVIHASLARDLNGDQQPDLLIIASDEQGAAQLEVVAHGSARAGAQLRLAPEPVATGCRAVGGKLAALANELDLASVVFLCDEPNAPDALSARAPAPQPRPGNPGSETPSAPTAPGTPTPPTGTGTLDEAPPEPSAAHAITQHFVFSVQGVDRAPQLVLRLCADWNEQGEPLSPELAIRGDDVDGDQNADIEVSLPLTAAETSNQEPGSLTLTWLNRPTGFARERGEPEASLATLAQAAYQAAQKKPEASKSLAARVLRMHRLLCKESGAAQLWADDVRGVSCGVSSAAGKAAAANALALAHTQALLPALEARAQLDDPALAIDKKARQQVSDAIGAIRGDTGYSWHMGPALRPPSAPPLHLPLLGFIDDNTLLMRGPVAQAYDLTTRSATPTGIAGGVLATDPRQRFALTDIVRACDGYHVRSVPAGQVIGGVVTGAVSSEPLLQPAAAAPNSDCTRPHSERGGFVLLGTTPAFALFAHGASLRALPFDAEGQVGEAARDVPSRENLPPLQTPGPLDQSGRYLALAVSEGVALIDRAQNSARLVRTPASCAGQAPSDAALSPSGRKLAMLCGGHVYVAEPAAVSGTGDRPISEHP